MFCLVRKENLKCQKEKRLKTFSFMRLDVMKLVNLVDLNNERKETRKKWTLYFF